MQVLKLLLLLIIFSSQYSAQELITDRPDQTESAVTVPLHSLQIETGFAYESLKENGFSFRNYTVAGTLFRYGLIKNIELRFGTGYLISEANETISGFGDFLFGGKINFLIEEQSGLDFGLLIHTALPIGDETLNPNKFEPELIAALSKSLSENFSISFNFGGSHNSSIEEIIYVYTGALGISLSEELSAFAELYGNFSKTFSPLHNFDGGFTYLLSDTVQLDISGGKGITGIGSYWFISSGVSLRIDNL
ncbi:MAG TPA: transporter [Ignavibacteriaceae bacterium]|nr:transporter [Ignavibacteriaceae bacterium]